jgi:hypothetical protein
MTATPNALERTAPGVTLAAADHLAVFAHPAPVGFPQPARCPSVMAELGVVRLLAALSR